MKGLQMSVNTLVLISIGLLVCLVAGIVIVHVGQATASSSTGCTGPASAFADLLEGAVEIC